MPKNKADTIKLKGNPIVNEEKVTSQIFPGDLIEFDEDKGVKPVNNARANQRKAFAFENVLAGKTITDEYKVGERVIYGVFSSGEVVNARIAARTGAIKKGDSVEASNGGTLKKSTSASNIIGYALESVDNSSGNEETFIQVEVQ